MLSSIKYPREWSRVASGKLVLNAEESLTITDTNDMSSGKKVKLYSKSSIFFVTIFHPPNSIPVLGMWKNNTTFRDNVEARDL